MSDNGLLHPGSTFDGEKVRNRSFLDKLNAIADLALRIRDMQVSGCRFENTPSGIVIAVPEVKPSVGGGGTSLKLVRIDEHADLYSKTIDWGDTGSAASTVVAWTYGGVECALDTSSPDGSVVEVDGGLEWSATGASSLPKIYNPHEFSATTTIVNGILVDSTNFPSGTRIRPLDASGTSNTHSWTPIVWVTTSVNSDGDTIWVIVSPRNQFDGACI